MGVQWTEGRGSTGTLLDYLNWPRVCFRKLACFFPYFCSLLFPPADTIHHSRKRNCLILITGLEQKLTVGEELFGLQSLTAGINYLFFWKEWTGSLFGFQDTLIPKETPLNKRNNGWNCGSSVLLTALSM